MPSRDKEKPRTWRYRPEYCPEYWREERAREIEKGN